MDKDKKICPKCSSECNTTKFTHNVVYIFCLKCKYQTWERKYKERNGFIQTIKELYEDKME